jgi:putative transposase
MRELEFATAPSLGGALRDVQADFDRDLDARMDEEMDEFLNWTLRMEAWMQLGAARYQRSDLRVDYRAGYRPRTITTHRGTYCLQVPRARSTPLRFSLFERYQRVWTQVEDTLRDTFLAGCSTRRTGEVLEKLLGIRLSPQTVSRAVQQLTPLVERFHRRALEDHYRVLFLDGVTQTIRTGARGPVTKLVLVAYGITHSGHRELIDFQTAPSESRAAWFGFLNRLFHRGLTGDRLELITSDGCAGLAVALEEIYPHVRHQTCWAHKMRNLAEKVKEIDRRRLCASARKIYLAPNRKTALAAFRRLQNRWMDAYPSAVRSIENHLDTLLAFFDFPEHLRHSIRTTNLIERCFREVRRRTRPISSFANVQSCERITYAIFIYLNTKWERTPLSQFAHKS